MISENNFIQMSLHIISDESSHLCTEVVFSFNGTQLVCFSSIPLSGVTCWLNKWSSKKGLVIGIPVAIIDIDLRENIIAYKRYEDEKNWRKFDISIWRFMKLLHSMKTHIGWDMDILYSDLMDLLLKEDMVTERMIVKMLEGIKPLEKKQTSLWQD